MWLADEWKDYEIIDCSGGEKLERWGKYLLVRPDRPGNLGYAPDQPRMEKKKRTLTTAAARAADSGNFLTCPISGPSATRGLPFT